VRDPWLTSVFGVVLLIGIPVEFITWLLSYAAYDPKLGNDPNPDHGLFGLYLFNQPTVPAWFYRVNEGTHVVLGLVLVPVVLAKLCFVMPKLFAWPPWRSIAELLEWLSLVLIVGGVAFEITTGILYIDYADRINFISRALLRCVGLYGRVRRACLCEVRQHVRRPAIETLRDRAKNRAGRHPARAFRWEPRRTQPIGTYDLPARDPRLGRGHVAGGVRADLR